MMPVNSLCESNPLPLDVKVACLITGTLVVDSVCVPDLQFLLLSILYYIYA